MEDDRRKSDGKADRRDDVVSVTLSDALAAKICTGRLAVVGNTLGRYKPRQLIPLCDTLSLTFHREALVLDLTRSDSEEIHAWIAA